MGKTQEHSDDVRRKVVELHKSRNGHKKISKQSKIPISTIMELIEKFKATGDVKNQPAWKRTCVYIDPTHREEDGSTGKIISKDHSSRIAEVSLGVKKSPKLPSDIHYFTAS